MYSSSYLLLALVFVSSVLAMPQPQHGHYGPATSAASVAVSPTISLASVTNPTAVATQTSSGSAGGSVSGSGSSVCDATSTVMDGAYTLMANIWGATPGSGGTQCAQGAGSSGSGIAWTSTWSWDSGSNIKSFANANGNSLTPCKAVSEINTIPSTWKWSYNTDSIMADVAYDIFLGGSACYTPGGGHPYEVMIWLAAYGGLKPIDGGRGSIGTFTSGGTTFDIYTGSNPNNGIATVYSFYPTSGNNMDFSGDIKSFLAKLATLDPGINSANLQSIQAGTEAANGAATFSVSEYSIGGS